jgi:hypothetical protein
MLRKAAATLLLLLIASPFTAPFETCDVFTLFGSHMPAAQDQYQASFLSTGDQSAMTVAAASRRSRTRSRAASPVAAEPELEHTPRAVYVTDATTSPAPLVVALAAHPPLRI